MNRNEAIERAASDVIEAIERDFSIDKNYGDVIALREALAMPKDAEPVAHTDAEIQALIEHMDSDPLQSKNALITQREWQIIKSALTAKPKANAERDCKDCEALLEDITELNKELNPEAYGIVDTERVALCNRVSMALWLREKKMATDTLSHDCPMDETTASLLRDIRAYIGGA